MNVDDVLIMCKVGFVSSMVDVIVINIGVILCWLILYLWGKDDDL